MQYQSAAQPGRTPVNGNDLHPLAKKITCNDDLFKCKMFRYKKHTALNFFFFTPKNDFFFTFHLLPSSSSRYKKTSEQAFF